MFQAPDMGIPKSDQEFVLKGLTGTQTSAQELRIQPEPNPGRLPERGNIKMKTKITVRMNE